MIGFGWISLSTLHDRFSPEHKQQALEAVLESNTFARADQLRRFLRYVCEKEIAGQEQDISEYSIATEALGRSAKYSPGEDSSVRGRAHALRQKLHEYYETESPDQPIRIELRKGGYVPLFLASTEGTHSIEVSQIREPLQPVFAPVALLPQKASSQGIVAAFAAGILIAALSAWVYISFRERDARPTAILAEAWGSALDPKAEVLICVGSPPALLLKSFRKGKLPDSPLLMVPPKEVGAWYSGLQEMDGGGDLYMQTTMNNMLSGDALAAMRAVRFLTGFGVSVQVLPEWGTRAFAFRGRNVLLIGSPNYSPYAGRILASTPFTVRYDEVQHEEVISDGVPGVSGITVYRPKRDAFGELVEVYGLLTVVPSQFADRREQTVIFSGVTGAGPQAAMEFFSSPSSLRELKQRFLKQGHASMPHSYQVVLRCGVDRALALTWKYEAHRVITQPPPPRIIPVLLRFSPLRNVTKHRITF